MSSGMYCYYYYYYIRLSLLYSTGLCLNKVYTNSTLLHIEGLKCAKLRWDINRAIENNNKMSFLEAREIGRKWEKEVMTEDEDDEEEIDTYKMGISMMISDKDRIERIERQVELQNNEIEILKKNVERLTITRSGSEREVSPVRAVKEYYQRRPETDYRHIETNEYNTRRKPQEYNNRITSRDYSPRRIEEQYVQRQPKVTFQESNVSNR